MSIIDDISSRLAEAEAEFLDIDTANGPALHDLHYRLTALLGDVERVLSTQEVDDATMESWSDTALRLVTMNEFLLEADELSERLRQEMTTAFSQIDVESSAPDHSRTKKRQKQLVQVGSTSKHDPLIPDYRGSPYIEKAYLWLLNNLHNPYPPKRVRDEIAISTGTSKDLIDAWFISARQRIGWTALRKTRFSNKRADIVDAATCFFRQDTTSRRALHLHAHLELEFVTIEKAAKDLYGGRFSDEGFSVIDATKPSRRTRRKGTKGTSTRNPYPSPALSSDEREVANRHSTPDRLESVSQLVGPGIRTRSTSLSGSENEPISSQSSSLIDVSPANPHLALPSPGPSELEHDCSPTQVPQASEYLIGELRGPLEVSSRKRRHSDTQDQPPTKRLRKNPSNASSSEHSRAPSPTYTTEEPGLDEWFRLNKTLPVDIPNANLMVEVFNYESPRTTSSSSSFSGTVSSDSSLPSPAPTIGSNDLLFQESLDIATPLDYNLFEDLQHISEEPSHLGANAFTTQWDVSLFNSMNQASCTLYNPLETNATLSTPIEDLHLASLNSSGWEMGTQDFLSSVNNPASINPNSTLNQTTEMTFGDFSQFLALANSSKEGLRRRLEELVAEASLIQQRLNVVS